MSDRVHCLAAGDAAPSTGWSKLENESNDATAERKMQVTRGVLLRLCRLPEGLTWAHIYGAAALAGIVHAAAPHQMWARALEMLEDGSCRLRNSPPAGNCCRSSCRAPASGGGGHPDTVAVYGRIPGVALTRLDLLQPGRSHPAGKSTEDADLGSRALATGGPGWQNATAMARELRAACDNTLAIG